MEIMSSIITGLIGLIGAFIGAVITGSISYKIAKLNIDNTNRIREEENKFREENKRKEEFRNRPDLRITNFSSAPKRDENNRCDIELIFLLIKGFDGTFMIYSKEVFDENNLVEYIYELENIGNTNIESVWISTALPKNTSIMTYSIFEDCKRINKNILNYKECYDYLIRPNEKFLMKILCNKTEVIAGSIGASITLWLEDVNGNWWEQPLFFPSNTPLKNLSL